jgi:hypothetical protein
MDILAFFGAVLEVAEIRTNYEALPLILNLQFC